VLAAVKVRPGEGGVCCTAGATADLDGVCARRRTERQVGAKERIPDKGAAIFLGSLMLGLFLGAGAAVANLRNKPFASAS